ncbi:type IV secretion protein Rhs [Serratia microhaemolytica]|uniref:type IV secretion protein Rhs n=1 Tax=Serratia microhaemolytica TaxID=2675110 RepID=UPI000FDE0E25|nr:type IV secretion protein Rhs [Serratia microhaemolytica]
MTLDDEIKEKIISLPYYFEIINNWEKIADKLSDSFSWIGSKIDWSKTKGHNHLKLKGNYSDWLIDIDKFIKEFNLDKEILDSKNIFYINDSSLDFSVAIPSDGFYPFLEMAIMNIPQHHYFFDQNKKWGLVITSEGYVDFGFSQKA